MGLLSKSKIKGWAIFLLILLGVLFFAVKPVLYVRLYGDPAKVLNDFERAKVPEGDLERFLVLAGPRISSELEKRVQDKNVALRRYMIGALGSVGGPDALPVLKGIRDDEQEAPHIRDDARASIRLLSGNLQPDETHGFLDDLLLIYEVAG